MAQISVRVDDAVKRGAEQTFNDIGLSMNAAITVFLKACAREKPRAVAACRRRHGRKT